MDDDLFTESSDKIKKMVDDAVKEATNKKDTKTDGNEVLANFIKNYTDTFRKAGFSRKEAVYLSGQILNGYVSGFSNTMGLLGGMFS